MLEFLISWAEQLIIALIIIVIIEMILPNTNNYKKYVKIILGTFLIYIIISPMLSEKIKDIQLKEVASNKYDENNINITQSMDNYNYQIEKTYKMKFEEDIRNYLQQKGYSLITLNQDIKYQDEEIEINKLELKIQKENFENDENIEIKKIEIKEKEEISDKELENLKKEISINYEIDENKIILTKEKNDA